MWRDDIDTALRHLDLYDRFGCPGGHVQAAFRCLTRFGAQIDPKVAETLNSRVHACWINPAAQPQTAAAATPPAPTTAGSAATPAAGRNPRPGRDAGQISSPATGTIPDFRGWDFSAPSKRHGVIRVVKSRGRTMLDLPVIWSDLGDGSAFLPTWPLMV